MERKLISILLILVTFLLGMDFLDNYAIHKSVENEIKHSTVTGVALEPNVKETESLEQTNIIEETAIEEPTIEAEEIVEVETTYTFLATGYCACEKCCGKTDGITATGTIATPNRTIAVDPKVVPYGTELLINGIRYIAEDCGGAINKNRVDIFFGSHQEALEFGVQYVEVTIL